ncbi:ubiquinol-cytochrome c reductase iron-sulfur subunit precursor [Grosmannia clavigera kw1407]|uniref:Cytochrome b-c1 complex subunit Rieske, mitochondrial n=1 Tax=Grosmannia clavigera (strain kw1407 / UAMH 11150) TaxID=655863 RepID=F0X8D5_GROCL|nr:ubiquinol-cytochrome c reductase iron-sulfur subunit precursor [Grosmannia clavigera kw1407]EFX05577.1 ubiquinol-cytochrome c reductase iron-sulfur subunit precursor [Grosmannia clavigera kw1407]
MAPLTTASRLLARSAVSARSCQAPSTPRALVAAAGTTATGPSPSSSSSFSTSVARAEAAGSSYTFKSPFRGSSKADSVPSFGDYLSKNSGSTNQLFGYFMVGTLGAISAAGAKSTVQEFLVNMSASADVLAMAKVEVDLNTIPEGKNVIIKWRGKPVFIRHRTEAEIAEANTVNIQSLRDPQADADRVKRPEWLVMLGVCTHLGCVPIGEAGDYGGWFCPCHGSHYDISGRIRKGPAPLNLEIPQYDFPEDERLVIG